MISDLYWIEGQTNPKLAIMARPRAGDWLEDEVSNWRREGVGVVVSLLEASEVADLDLSMEEQLCVEQKIVFLSFPIPDRGVPADKDAAIELARKIKSLAKPTAIHCRAGIGRSSLVAALVQILDGVSAEKAFSRTSAARRLPTPDTDDQKTWISAVAATLG